MVLGRRFCPFILAIAFITGTTIPGKRSCLVSLVQVVLDMLYFFNISTYYFEKAMMAMIVLILMIVIIDRFCLFLRQRII